MTRIKWPLLHGELSSTGLVKLIELCPPVTADHVAPPFLKWASKDSPQAFFVAIFRLLAECKQEFSSETVEKIDEIIKDDILEALALTELIKCLKNKSVEESAEKSWHATLKKVLIQAKEKSIQGPKISAAVSDFLQSAIPESLKILLAVSDQSAGRKRSVIQAKRQKVEIKPDFEFLTFILERLSTRGFDHIEAEINEILEISLRSEGQWEDAVQKSIVGIGQSY